LGVGTAVLTVRPRQAFGNPAFPVPLSSSRIGPLLASRNGQYSVVGAAQSKRDPTQLREWLMKARGYTVLARDGRRVGAFIELAGPGGERIAIRHDGVFLWRRRVLPITTVAKVFPKERAVLLNIDRHTLGSTPAARDAVVDPPVPAGEVADPPREWRELVERYIPPRESELDQADPERADVANNPSPDTAGLERALTDVASPPTTERATSNESSAARHLLFLSTSRGYVLVELDGSPPPLGQKIRVQEEQGSFLVAKLGPSPLPNDPRVCAYLERSREIDEPNP
jgi:hypothetical protein